MTSGATRLAFASAFAALIAALYWWHNPPPSQPKPRPTMPAAVAAVGQHTWLSDIGGTRPRSAVSHAGNQLSLAAQVDKLVASGDPEDAYQAFLLVQSCVDFKNGDTYIFDPSSKALLGLRERTAQEKQDEAARCQGMTERMKSSRLDHLAIAAKAGVACADIAFVTAGPFGDPSALKTRPDDPLVQAWKAQAIAQMREQASQGSPASINTLFAYYIGGNELVQKDPAQALSYAVALGQIYDAMKFPNPFGGATLADMESGLTPQQIADAKAAGTRMA